MYFNMSQHDSQGEDKTVDYRYSAVCAMHGTTAVTS